MSRFNLLAIVVLALSMSSSLAEASEPFSDAQELSIENIARGVILKNPEIVMQAAQAFQEQQQAERANKSADAVKKNNAQLLENPSDPTAGSKNGDVTLVEFFDYNCGYCKKAHEPLTELLRTDKAVRVVFKEYPILSESSQLAAKAALAAHKQGKYLLMHNALMEYKGSVTLDSIKQMATASGINVDRMLAEMDSADTAAVLSANLELGKSIGATGTPTFVIAEKVVPGAMGLEEMRALVSEARRAKK